MPEVFKPWLIGKESYGNLRIVCDSIMKCTCGVDTARDLYIYKYGIIRWYSNVPCNVPCNCCTILTKRITALALATGSKY